MGWGRRSIISRGGVLVLRYATATTITTLLKTITTTTRLTVVSVVWRPYVGDLVERCKEVHVLVIHGGEVEG